MGLLRRRRANGASEPAIFAAARASRTAPRYFFVFLRKHMTDSEKIAAPAEQPAASEKPMSAAADAVETPSEPAPEKKPRRPRRKKPAVEQATLELSAPENAVPAQPVEEQSVSAPPAPEAPAVIAPEAPAEAAETEMNSVSLWVIVAVAIAAVAAIGGAIYCSHRKRRNS